MGAHWLLRLAYLLLVLVGELGFDSLRGLVGVLGLALVVPVWGWRYWRWRHWSLRQLMRRSPHPLPM